MQSQHFSRVVLLDMSSGTLRLLMTEVNLHLLFPWRDSVKILLVADAPRSSRPCSDIPAYSRGPSPRFLVPPRQSHQQNRRCTPVLDVLMPGVGLEPTNPFGSKILSLLRKPFRHPGKRQLLASSL